MQFPEDLRYASLVFIVSQLFSIRFHRSLRSFPFFMQNFPYSEELVQETRSIKKILSPNKPAKRRQSPCPPIVNPITISLDHFFIRFRIQKNQTKQQQYNIFYAPTPGSSHMTKPREDDAKRRRAFRFVSVRARDRIARAFLSRNRKSRALRERAWRTLAEQGCFVRAPRGDRAAIGGRRMELFMRIGKD